MFLARKGHGSLSRAKLYKVDGETERRTSGRPRAARLLAPISEQVVVHTLSQWNPSYSKGTHTRAWDRARATRSRCPRSECVSACIFHACCAMRYALPWDIILVENVRRDERDTACLVHVSAHFSCIGIFSGGKEGGRGEGRGRGNATCPFGRQLGSLGFQDGTT